MTKFGLKQVNNHTPKWIITTISVTAVLLGVAQFLVAGDPTLPDDVKLRWNHYLTAAMMLVSGIAPFFGINLPGKRR